MHGGVRIGRAVAVAACIAALDALGCGKSRVPTYPVSGTVTFEDGRPVPFGVVEFRHDESQTIARAKLDRDGRFKLGTYAAADGAVAGHHQVIVVQHLSPAIAVAPSTRGNQRENPHAGHQLSLVAPQHASYNSSRLAVEVAAISDNQVTLVVERFSAPRE